MENSNYCLDRGRGVLSQHFLGIGIILTTNLTMIKHTPIGDSIEIRTHSYEFTLRWYEAEKIGIQDIRETIKNNISH